MPRNGRREKDRSEADAPGRSGQGRWGVGEATQGEGEAEKAQGQAFDEAQTEAARRLEQACSFLRFYFEDEQGAVSPESAREALMGILTLLFKEENALEENLRESFEMWRNFGGEQRV